MTAELVPRGGGELAFPPGLLGFAQDATMSWLLSYDSPNTRDGYRRDLAMWFDFCRETGLDPLQARKSHGDVYKRWLDLRAVEKTGKAVPPATMSRRLSSVSAWYDYLVDEEVIDANRFKGTRRPKLSRNHSETTALTLAEARQLIAAADSDHGPARLRTSAFIRVLVQTGVRIEEAVSADLAALGYERGLRSLRIVGKGTKPKRRRLPVETGYAIDRYLEDRARRAGVEVSQLTGRIFVTDTGGRFYRSSASELVARVGRQAGLSITPHVLRHTWASIAAELGADSFEIKDALDHESMDTTMRYVHSGRLLERDPSQLVASALE
ncbi:integrase/recombinase XerC [Nonomuraea maritima]|uniref:Integrase/recombinase XerC n=1 Tax=Nonomuraea maritima TaxID=683260 RepID=A0A1G9MJL1_9ACTN|nr:tyrosine-type recombinase/integrase [Nonomuraea maritima]SDL73825.1 integrase/recombinase XerC [Nonomuraea maritima]